MSRMQEIEHFVEATMSRPGAPEMRIAHDFKHVDQMNFQISFFGDLRTATAKRIGEPLVAFMRAYVIQLESEIDSGGHRSAGEVARPLAR